MFENCSAAALVLLSGVAHCKTGDAAGGEWSIWGLGVGVGRGEARRHSGIVESRRAERGGGDERNECFRGGAGAADAANLLRVAARYFGRNGVLPAKIAVRLRVRLIQLDREASYWS